MSNVLNYLLLLDKDRKTNQPKEEYFIMENQLAVLDPVKHQLAEISAQAQLITVETEETKELALEKGKELGGMKKKIFTIAKQLKDPLNAEIKKIITYEKSLQAQVTNGQSHLKAELLQWEQKLEKVRQEEQKKLEAERARIEEEKKVMAAKDVTPAKTDWNNLLKTPEEIGIKTKQAEIEKKVDLDQFDAESKRDLRDKEKEIAATRVKGATKVWKYEITSEAEIPREFFILDHSKIKAWMREKDLNSATINGVKFFQETRMSLR